MLYLYRKCFGIILILEMTFFSNQCLERKANEQPTFSVPLLEGLDDHVTLDRMNQLRALVIATSIVFISPHTYFQRLNVVILLVSYSLVRCSCFIAWNNHYYLNMICLALFACADYPTTTGWESHAFKTFFATVYIFSGLCKLSRSWTEGWIVDGLVQRHPLPLHVDHSLIIWGGLILDLVGGLLLLFSSLNRFIILIFFFFHLSNFIWLFESIQFFPLHMMASCLLYHAQPRHAKWAYLIILVQAFVAARRIDDLNLFRVNERLEWEGVHFAWRMKHRVVSSIMSEALVQYDDRVESKVEEWDEFRDSELVRQSIGKLRGCVAVKVVWWLRVNRWPFQLVYSPMKNLVDNSEIEPLIDLPVGWEILLHHMYVIKGSRRITDFATRATDVYLRGPIAGVALVVLTGRLLVRLKLSDTSLLAHPMELIELSDDWDFKTLESSLWVIVS